MRPARDGYAPPNTRCAPYCACACAVPGHYTPSSAPCPTDGCVRYVLMTSFYKLKTGSGCGKRVSQRDGGWIRSGDAMDSPLRARIYASAHAERRTREHMESRAAMDALQSQGDIAGASILARKGGRHALGIGCPNFPPISKPNVAISTPCGHSAVCARISL
ncbi:hypothetical protein GQ54DRAFT_191289 [Martensiomyces pterosporus]|nr:hypothetical protein GQ54DRAFT_191289 [Martensiomyces pterosporus]